MLATRLISLSLRFRTIWIIRVNRKLRTVPLYFTLTKWSPFAHKVCSYVWLLKLFRIQNLVTIDTKLSKRQIQTCEGLISYNEFYKVGVFVGLKNKIKNQNQNQKKPMTNGTKPVSKPMQMTLFYKISQNQLEYIYKG